jgi:hypothetical protein
MVRVVLVFIHVTGAMGVFAALAVEGAVLLQIHRATDAPQLRAALHAFGLVPRVGMPSLLVTLISGLYLTASVWGWRVAWIDVAFLAMIATAVIGAALTGPRIARLEKTLIRDDRHDSMLWASFIMRTCILIGVVFLMTVKPPLNASLIAMVTAAGVGVVAALPRRARSSADSMVSA